MTKIWRYLDHAECKFAEKSYFENGEFGHENFDFITESLKASTAQRENFLH